MEPLPPSIDKGKKIKMWIGKFSCQPALIGYIIIPDKNIDPELIITRQPSNQTFINRIGQ